jgi:hypothetical protein
MLKLDAVREMLARNGLQHITALDTGGASMAATAERTLDREELAFQTIGWHYNTRRKVTLSPSLFTFNSAAWTASTNGLTQAGKFVNATVGQTLSISSGTTTTGNAVVTAVDPSGNWVNVDTALNATDLASGVAGSATNNIIAVPTGAIWIDTDLESYSIDAAQNGSRLYDVENGTQFWDRDLVCTYAVRLSFECIPELYARHIMLMAAAEFAAAYGNKDRQRSIQNALYDSHGTVRAADARLQDYNVLNSIDALRTRGMRRTGVYVEGTWAAP